MKWKVFGHEHVKRVLEKQLASGKLPHAYLFFGPESLGKHALALELAAQILKTENALTHPDFMQISDESEIPVEKVREMISSISLKPIAGSKKVAIIDNAERLNKSGANALLKTLEEPGESTVIILVSSRALLPTIVSRCQKFSFNPLSYSRVLEFVSALENAPQQHLLDSGFNLPGRIVSLSKNPDFLAEEEENLRELRKIKGLREGERILEVLNYADKDTAELRKIFLSWTLRLFYEFQSFGQRAEPLKSAVNALRGLDLNQNKKLILQNLFLNL